MLLSLLDASPRVIGGKGVSLQRLARHRLPAPPPRVLPVAAFQAFLRHNQLWDDAVAGRPGLEARILAGEVPFTVPTVAPLVAVRSSAREEDGRAASHAGQYESVLGVAPA